MIRVEKPPADANSNCLRLLLIGIGNPFRSDDAAGLIAVRRIRENAPGDVIVHETSADPASLMDLWKSADVAVLVDAVWSGAPAGQLHRLEAHRGPLPADLFSHSTHGFGVAQAVEMGRVLGSLPDVLILYGIEGADFSPGTELSAEVVVAVDRVVEQVRQELNAWRSSATDRKECTHA